MPLRASPRDFPDDIAVQRRAPYESRADSVMYRQVLDALACARGWDVHLYDARIVEGQAVSILAERADHVLRGPRTILGPPWAKDHRMALVTRHDVQRLTARWPGDERSPGSLRNTSPKPMTRSATDTGNDDRGRVRHRRSLESGHLYGGFSNTAT